MVVVFPVHFLALMVIIWLHLRVSLFVENTHYSGLMVHHVINLLSNSQGAKGSFHYPCSFSASLRKRDGKKREKEKRQRDRQADQG